jgi:hypothetical protein
VNSERRLVHLFGFSFLSSIIKSTHKNSARKIVSEGTGVVHHCELSTPCSAIQTIDSEAVTFLSLPAALSIISRNPIIMLSSSALFKMDCRMLALWICMFFLCRLSCVTQAFVIQRSLLLRTPVVEKSWMGERIVTKSHLDYKPQRKNDDEAVLIHSDWWQAELTLMKAPSEPSPDLSPEMVALTVARSLQWVDYPQEAAGLQRVFSFLTWECRKTVTARRGADAVERFVLFGSLAPALQPFMGASYISLGEPTYLPAQPPSRGAIMSFPILIRGHPSLCRQHPSGLQRSGITKSPPETKMVMRLEQQRRPPNLGCWLVREILDIRHVFAGDLGNVVD